MTVMRYLYTRIHRLLPALVPTDDMIDNYNACMYLQCHDGGT